MYAENDENCAPVANRGPNSNLMLLTQSRKADMQELQETFGAVKPEQDPFWEARGKAHKEKLVHNSVTESIKAKAVSKLFESTMASKASTRVKAYDEVTHDKKKEVPMANGNSTVSSEYYIPGSRK
jgi:hypothetical protein